MTVCLLMTTLLNLVLKSNFFIFIGLLAALALFRGLLFSGEKQTAFTLDEEVSA